MLCMCLLKLPELVLLRQTADFKLSVSTLRTSGILPSSGDILLQTEDLATRVRFILEGGWAKAIWYVDIFCLHAFSWYSVLRTHTSGWGTIFHTCVKTRQRNNKPYVSLHSAFVQSDLHFFFFAITYIGSILGFNVCLWDTSTRGPRGVQGLKHPPALPAELQPPWTSWFLVP